MDERKHLILLKGKNRTKDIRFIKRSELGNGYEVTFFTGNPYTYKADSVVWFQEPAVKNPQLYRIRANGRTLDKIDGIFVFGEGEEFWHIVCGNGFAHTWKREELQIETSCLEQKTLKDRFVYLTDLARVSELKGDDGDALLYNQYKKADFIAEGTALPGYLYPDVNPSKTYPAQSLIFPFGGNASQFLAVERALNNQLSVIQGPPGTGKTQTILNIIANLLIRGMTVQVVSNNNSATQNVLEKLSSPKYRMDFLVAALGKRENKAAFVKNQTGRYPDISEWRLEREYMAQLQQKINAYSTELSTHFSKQERLAVARQELSQLEVERGHFEQFCADQHAAKPRKQPRREIASKKVLGLLQECEGFCERNEKVSVWHKFKTSLFYGVFEWKFYKNDIGDVITYLQSLFYLLKQQELSREIEELERYLKAVDAKGKMDELTRCSMTYLRGMIYERWGMRGRRPVFTEESFWKAPEEILREYPITLSTTFSARTSLKKVTYDYLIMDEASQVDIVTGALALSVARNAVIVGDQKQLPNVVTDVMKQKTQAIFESYRVPEGYSFAGNSFLQSVCTVVDQVPQTLLREHYRCHPKIIGFCNQKFYHGELIVMTQDDGAEDTLAVHRTVAGSHHRGHVNQRQIEVTVREVLPTLSEVLWEEIGIVAPYRDQVKEMAAAVADTAIEVDTVHKYQGREKDAIILTTVDDELTDFSDDPYMLNVAVSRAKKKLRLVISGTAQNEDSNIRDLVAYMEYQNGQVVDSEIYSVFDLMYQEYTKERLEFLKKHQKISEYDSENLMYAALTELLESMPDLGLKVACHQSLRLLFRDSFRMTEEESKYASRPGTHVDFLLYNPVSKAPVLAIEVDGFNFHKDGTKQAQRDRLKDSIFEKYGIPLLRLPTNGSGEMEKVRRCVEKQESHTPGN